MGMSICLKMVTNGGRQILQLLMYKARYLYLALENCENFLGHRGHENWPLGSDMGVASILFDSAGGAQCADTMAER
jgi:hypothetical protein